MLIFQCCFTPICPKGCINKNLNYPHHQGHSLTFLAIVNTAVFITKEQLAENPILD